MDLNTFVTNFGLLADTPNGIPKLREMILQLAVMGKLVPQNPKDKPASVLLEKIDADIVKLIAEGKIKKSNPLIPIDQDEVPYELPKGWEWRRLMELGLINPRNEADDNIDAAFIPMPLISDKYGALPNFEVRPWKDIRKGFTHFAEGDVALAKITPCFQNGKSAVFERLPNGIGAGTTELHVFRPLGNTLIPKYVWLYLKSPRFLSEGETKMTGTAGQKRVPKIYFEGNPFPLPPLIEQKRIVSKVDELLALCDELEERQKKRDEVRVSVNAACLHEMTSPEVKISKKGWTRTRNHFDLLYDTPDNVAALRQSILQLAVMGKLVPQNPKDEPAYVLLEKIAAEKEKLIEEGKIKKPKLLPTIEPDEVPYELPEGWGWVRLGQIGNNVDAAIVDGPFGSSVNVITDYIEKGVPVIRMINLKPYSVLKEDLKFIRPEKFKQLRRHNVLPDDVLLGKVGSIGLCAVYPDNFPEAMLATTGLCRFRVGQIFSADYLCHLLNSLRPYLNEIASEAVQPFLSMKTINNIVIGLPPSAEQKRIVKKVDKLMALFDELESKLQESHSAGEKLMEAVVRKVGSVLVY
ncbi:MAG: restriction endonuclease subunit S [Desulfobacteraceae bacterium]|nr:restriction endonuclease subunit S [Desulfobacteraceae bacterium]